MSYKNLKKILIPFAIMIGSNKVFSSDPFAPPLPEIADEGVEAPIPFYEKYKSRQIIYPSIKEEIPIFPKLEDVCLNDEYKKLGSDNYQERQNATYTLLQLIDELELEDVLKLCNDKDAEVRARGRIVLGELVMQSRISNKLNLDEIYQQCQDENQTKRMNAYIMFRGLANQLEKFREYPLIEDVLTVDGIFVGGNYRDQAFEWINNDNFLCNDPTYHHKKVATYLWIMDMKNKGFKEEDIENILNKSKQNNNELKSEEIKIKKIRLD